MSENLFFFYNLCIDIYLPWVALVRCQVHFPRTSFKRDPGEPVSYSPFSPFDFYNQFIGQTGLRTHTSKEITNFFWSLSIKPVVLIQEWFLVLRGYLAMLGNIFDCHIQGKCCYSIWWIQVRDAAKYPPI